MANPEPTISLCLIGKDEKKYFLEEVIKSALTFCDEIIYVDTGSVDGTLGFLTREYPMVKQYYKEFAVPEDYTTCKNFAVSKATCDYVLTTDCDEVFSEEIKHLKKLLIDNPKIECFNLHGEHYMGDLVHFDRTTNVHIWQNRLFKRIPSIKYKDGTMHGLAEGAKTSSTIPFILVHHYGFCKNMIDALRRYETNSSDKSQNRDAYLKWQFYHMITGTYPGQPVIPYPITYYIQVLRSHPEVIKEKFHIEEIIKQQTDGIQN